MNQYKLLTLAAAISAVLHANPMQADSFTLLVYESKSDLATRTDPEKSSAYWAAYSDYAKKMTDAGILRGGSALSGDADTKTVTVVEGKSRTAERPLVSTSLVLGGYFVIEVPDQNAALEWAKKAPFLASGAVEVNRHFPNPTMSEKKSP
jgi:hypothetical protein